jgi:hypothetical protein
MNFKFHLPSTFILLVFTNMVMLKVVRPMTAYQHTKFYGPR